MKKYLFSAFMLMALSANAQTEVTFETQDYSSVGVYDAWEESPFRIQQGQSAPELAGNCAVVDNPFQTEEDLEMNASTKVLGVQRSRFGSNFFGARIVLNEAQRFDVDRTAKYVHVMINRPVSGRVMLIGLGKHSSGETWAYQTDDVIQFRSISTNTVGQDKWYDAVFEAKGNGDIDIYSLVVVPECESPHARTEDFVAYIDNIVVDNSASPRITYEDYAVNFDKSASPSRSDRYLNSIEFNGSLSGNQTVSLNTDHKPYQDLTATPLKAKAGETITPKFNYQGNWMHGYVYLDRDGDGKFKNEAVAYSYYSGKNSTGATVSNQNVLNPPTFQLPSDLENGYYRVRYKVDWDEIDAMGATSLMSNGGSVTDIMINVHGDQVNVAQSQLNGNIYTAEGGTIDNMKVPFGQAFTFKVAPAEGFLCDTIRVRYGYNLAGDQYVHGNRQWQELVIYNFEIGEDGLYTLPAEVMEGDVDIQAFFQDEKVHTYHALRDVSRLNNTTAFTMTTKSRGYLWMNGTNLTDSRTGTEDLAKKEFVLITNNAKKYLYSVSAKKFLAINGTGAQVTDGAPSEVTVTQNADGDYMFIFTLAGKTVNIGGSNQLVINDWSTADVGNRFKIEAIEAFDPTEALERLKVMQAKAGAATVRALAVNLPLLYPADKVATFDSRLEEATTMEEISSTVDALYRVAENKAVCFSCANVSGDANAPHYAAMSSATATSNQTTRNKNVYFRLLYAGDRLYRIQNISTGGYLAKFTRNSAISGSSTAAGACLYALEWNASANNYGDQLNVRNTQSTTGYSYMNDGNNKLVDWTADGASSKWTLSVLSIDKVAAAIAQGTEGVDFNNDGVVDASDVKTTVNYVLLKK